MAAEEAGWNPSTPPFREVLDQLGRDNVLEFWVRGIVGDLMKAVWTNPVLSFRAEEVTRRLLDKLDERKGGRKIIGQLFAAVERLFGMQVVAAAYSRRAMEHWLRLHEVQGIIVP